MQAARLTEPASRTPLRIGREPDRDATLDVLRETVAALAERVEFLESREEVTRAALCLPRSRRRKSA